MKSLDVLAEFACLLVFYRKAKRDSSNVDEHVIDVNNMCVEFIKDGRVELAEWILTFLQTFEKPGIKDYTRKMLRINLALVAKKRERHSDIKIILDEVDWSAAAEEFRMCVASLNDDLEGVIKLMRHFKDEGKISREAFREWPVFEHLRDKEPFQRTFREVFEEPLWAVDTSLPSVSATADTTTT